VKLALRLIAVGIVVLASLLYAGAVQIGARNAAISSYLVGQDAVRLVERLDDVSAAVATYYPSGKPDADRDSVQAIGTALGRVDADAQASGLNDGITEPQIARLRPGLVGRADALARSAARPVDERGDARIVPARRRDRRHAR